MALLGEISSLHHHANGVVKGETLQQSLHMDRLLHWLVSRQTSVLQEEEEYEVSDEETAGNPPREAPESFHVEGAIISQAEMSRAATPLLDVLGDELLWAGFNGRCNKTADTCYSFWNAGALAVNGCWIIHRKM